jgi:hypothetical protein
MAVQTWFFDSEFWTSAKKEVAEIKCMGVVAVY